MTRQRFRLWMPTALILGALSVSASEFANDSSVNDYYPGCDLKLPVRVREKTFSAGEGKANFTYFGGVENVEVQNGA